MQATSREEIEEAVKAGASIISVVGKLREEAVELKQHIPEEVRRKPSCASLTAAARPVCVCS